MKTAYTLIISLLLSSSMATAAVGADLDRFLEGLRPLPGETQDAMVLKVVEAQKDQLSASEFLRLATGRTYENATGILTLAVTRFEDPMSLEILLEGAFRMLWSSQAQQVEEAASAAIQARASQSPIKFYTCFQLTEKFHYLSEIQKMLILCGSQADVTDTDLARMVEKSREVFNGWTTESMQEPVEQVLVEYVIRNIPTISLARCTEVAGAARYLSVKEKILGHCQTLVGRKTQPVIAAPVVAASENPVVTPIKTVAPKKKKKTKSKKGRQRS